MYLNKYNAMTEQENNKNTQQEQNNKKPQDHSGIKMEGRCQCGLDRSGVSPLRRKPAVSISS
jgi:hypothetical protein